MDPNTGQIFSGTIEAIREAEKKAGVKFVPIKPRDLERVQKMNTEARRAYAKRVERERARRKAKRNRRKRR